MWSFYNTDGSFSSFKVSGIYAEDIGTSTPSGLTAIEGDYDHLSQKIDLTTLAGLKNIDMQLNEPLASDADDKAIKAREALIEQRETLRSSLVIDYQPPQPGNDYEWSIDAKRWLIKNSITLKASLVAAAQDQLDTVAKSRGYDGILSLCTYATSSVAKFAAEGQAGVAWRDAVWAHCYQVLADVEAGTRETPSAAQLISELPTITW